MANHIVIRIGNDTFRLIATVGEGQTLYLTAGTSRASGGHRGPTTKLGPRIYGKSGEIQPLWFAG